MPFSYGRTIRFAETDAAGVVYFANCLCLCHEAYEAALAEAGVNLKLFFSSGAIAVPIVHAEVDFYQPLFCGDRVEVGLTPQALDQSSFVVSYQIWRGDEGIERDRPLAQALTRHVCIDRTSRRRRPLTAELQQWLAQFSAAGRD
ncbi:acyl-CoA thioesterase [Almyronema epifaneia]|uniref:1,4-dihydroxy-2-naphthoyl-CoA hydrolase n=1 Tax=Almyronema epifaneia S1 TaxID=2991925 RepID=A0ABW6IEP1_9CYAN